ncbi:MAG: extracellular solute-binding protein [Dermatophilus congolensis]|nr:extracellular solute-binding protein [Dermatophilus congolensis]
MPRSRLTAVVGTVAALSMLAACAGGGPSDVPGGAAAGSGTPAETVQFYGYGVAKVAYEKVIPAFQQTPEGAGTQFQESYGPSGDQSRKVASGSPADFVAFSVEPEIIRLVDAGLVSPDWNQGEYKGVPFGSIVVMVVRPGNPKGINDWPDLLKPGVEVVTPNPLSSGAAMWNLLAPYSVLSKGGVDPQAGIAYADKLVTDHIHLQPKSGREATEAFLQGAGDVLLSYENEAKFLERKGDPIEYLVPPQTFRIETPVAVVTGGQATQKARQFDAFLSTPTAQRVVAEAGFRPSDPQVLAEHSDSFPIPDRIWTVGDLGGWTKVRKELFDPDSGSITTIYERVNR